MKKPKGKPVTLIVVESSQWKELCGSDVDKLSDYFDHSHDRLDDDSAAIFAYKYYYRDTATVRRILEVK